MSGMCGFAKGCGGLMVRTHGGAPGCTGVAVRCGAIAQYGQRVPMLMPALVSQIQIPQRRANPCLMSLIGHGHRLSGQAGIAALQ